MRNKRSQLALKDRETSALQQYSRKLTQVALLASNELIKGLLNQGASPLVKNNNGDDAILLLADRGDKLLMELALNNLNSYDKAERVLAAASRICLNGNIKWASELMEKYNIKPAFKIGATLLSSAAKSNKIELVKILIDKVLPEMGSKGKLLCDLVIDYYSPDMAKLFLPFMDVNTKDKNGKTPLVRRLEAPYYWASNDEEFLELLLNSGANPNERGENGVTPLMRVAKSGTVNTFNLMLKKGGDLFLVDDQGKSVIDYVRDPNLKETIEIILLSRQEKEALGSIVGENVTHHVSKVKAL